MSMFLQIVLAGLLSITAIFLILLVLIQRGRGGGLAGAFGGAGGQSAFGTKAGDLFTRITIGAAAFWLVLCAVSDKLLSSPGPSLSGGLGKQVTAPPVPQGMPPGAAPTEGKDAAPLQGVAGPSAVSPDTAAPSTESPKAVLDAGSQSLPPGSLGPNGAVLPQQPLPQTTPAGEPPAAANPTGPAPSVESAAPPPATAPAAPAESK